jgi:hypothetical protein
MHSTRSFNNQQLVISYLLVLYESHGKTVTISLIIIKKLIFVTLKCDVSFAVRTEFLKYYLGELRLQEFRQA